MLEEPHRIDLVNWQSGGEILLVITDAGAVTDADERLDLLVENIRACAAFVVSEAFIRDFPDKSAGDVRIVVMCATPPTERMEEFTRISPAEHSAVQIPIAYQVMPQDAPRQSRPQPQPGIRHPRAMPRWKGPSRN